MIGVWPVAEIESAKRRLETLRYLTGIPGYEAAASILRDHCRRIGVPTTTDQMHACVAWLEEHRLARVRLRQADPVVRVTQDGREVALGFKVHPGVMQPEP